VQADHVKRPTSLASLHDTVLDRLAALHRHRCDSALLARIVSPEALPQRLRERLRALGLQRGAPQAMGADDSGESQKRLRMESMRKRQEVMLQRMRQQQHSAATQFEGMLDVGEDGTEGDVASGAEHVGRCSTCREAGRWASNPMAVVSAICPSNMMKFHGGSACLTARFTSCGHLIHASCCDMHAATVRAQAHERTQSFFVNPLRGEFPCPMCRSFANCALPCVAVTDLLEPCRVGNDRGPAGGETADDGGCSIASLTEWLPAGQAGRCEPLRVRLPPPALRRALLRVDRRTACAMREADLERVLSIPEDAGLAEDAPFTSQMGSLILDAASMELAVASALSPLQLVDHGPPMPLYVTLLRCAALIRRVEAKPPRPPEPPLSEGGVFEGFPGGSQPPSVVWPRDAKAALTEALVDGLCSEAGLSQESFSVLTAGFLQVRALQLCAVGRNDGTADFVAGLVAFLAFAVWLCAAIWHLPAVERTRLAHLEPHDPCALLSLSTLLRLGGLSSWEEVLTAARRHSPPAGTHLLALDVDWALPGRSPLVPFIPLPEHYLELIRRVHRKVCAHCGREPPEPALCLTCGTLVCMDSKVCRGRNTAEGQCTDHARRCGAGQGLFILPHLALVLAVSSPVCCLWDCPYVDQHGEPNPYLRRPCIQEFRLDVRRLDSLRQIYTKASVHREIILHNEKTRSYIERAL